ncbi:MAG: hypothetical protein V4612_04415 [Pseudomonadota bacterium]
MKNQISKEAQQKHRTALKKAKFDHKQYKQFIREEIARIPNVNQEPLELILDQLTPPQLEIIRAQTKSSASPEFRATMMVLILALCTGHMGAQEGVDFVLPETTAYDFLPDYSEALAKASLIAGQITSAAAPFVPMAVSKSRRSARSFGAAAATSAALGSLPTVSGAVAKNKVNESPEFMNFFYACGKGELRFVTPKLEEIKTQLGEESDRASKRKAKEFLLSVDKGNVVSPLFFASNLNQPQVVKAILESVKDSEDFLREILMREYAGSTTFLHPCNKGNHKVVKVILDIVKDNPELLKEILTQKDQSGVSSFLWACNKMHHKIIKLIVEAVKEYPEILKEILREKLRGDSVMQLLCEMNRDQTKLIIDIFRSDMDFLKEILEDQNSTGNSALYSASAIKKDPELVKLILDAVKSDANFLEKILTQPNNNLRITALVAAVHDNDLEIMEVILDVLIPNHPEILKKILGKDAPVILNDLLVLGHNHLIKKMLPFYPEVRIDRLPDHYATPHSGTIPHYLRSLASSGFLSPNSNLKVETSSLEATGQLKAVALEDAFLNDPILVDAGGKKTLIMPFIDLEHYNNQVKTGKIPQFKSDIQHSLEVASQNKADIVLKVTGAVLGSGHAVVLKLSPTEKGLWKVRIIDSNPRVTDQYFCDEIEKILLHAGIAIYKPKIDPVIIPNVSNSLADGFCSQIADMNIAFIASGLALQAQKYCESAGRDCVFQLVKKLHPPIEKSLSAKLQTIKEEMKNPPAMPSPRESQKLAGQHREL